MSTILNIERPVDAIVREKKQLIIQRNSLRQDEAGLQRDLAEVGSKLSSIEDRMRLLDTNINRALIQEIEEEG